MSLDFYEDRANELSSDVCALMARVVHPTNWFRIELVYLAAGDASEISLYGSWKHEVREIETTRPEIEIPLQELRRIMYSPGAGTWFLARFYLEPDMTSTVVYDFDYDPKFKHDLDSSVWRQELERFPRDPGYLPRWLKEAAT
ncbi:hypothetical protein ACFYTF_18225 [Nocardia thailandica]|uniref:DUF600 family protein n=1 Tax=Nocardia thailandica TaxID=257275 RepID=A0ABW6PQZ4_9NOCA